MYLILKLKKFIIKILTCWILSKKLRKNTRNFLFYFSLYDFFQLKKQNFKIVSLGYNCLPRVLTTATKLKPRKIYGEKTYPFDLSIHSDINEITKQIKTNFETYLENIIKKETWENPTLKAKYPHDKYLTIDEFKHRYKKRIENFNEIINNPKIIYFIYANYESKIEKIEVINLYNVLKEKRGNKPFNLILLLNNKIENIENPNIIQLISDFKIEHANWGEYFINEYGNKKNKYTEFCNTTGEKLSQIIKKHQF